MLKYNDFYENYMLIGSHTISSFIMNFCEKRNSTFLIDTSLYFPSKEYNLTVPFLNPNTSKCPLFENFRQFILDSSQ